MGGFFLMAGWGNGEGEFTDQLGGKTAAPPQDRQNFPPVFRSFRNGANTCTTAQFRVAVQ